LRDWPRAARAAWRFGHLSIWGGVAGEDDVRMALRPLSANELAGTRTVLGSFLGQAAGERCRERKTVSELLEMYREHSETLPAAEDHADDLRVGRFIAEMAGDQWSSDVVVRLGVFDDTLLVIDGVHRSVAYLACLEDGIGPERLPALHVDR
jgi:hypothetical protein